MSDFEKFQRAQRKADSERAERESAAENADIAADDAYERKHARSVRDSHGHREMRTPIWRFSAGTWSTLLLIGVYWAAFIAVIVATTKQQELQSIAMMIALVPAIVCGFVTWRMLGPRARDVVRTAVRFSPLVLLTTCGVLGALKSRDSKHHAIPAADAGVAVTTTSPMDAPLRPLNANAPIDVLRAALAGPDAMHALDAIADSHRQALSQLQASRRVPSEPPSLGPSAARLAELRTLVPDVVAYASAHVSDLVAVANAATPLSPSGAAFALRFAPVTPVVVVALTPAFQRPAGPAERRANIDALTTLAKRAPPEQRSAVIEAIPDGVWRAWLRARVDADIAEPCRALGVLTLDAEEVTRALAHDALRDLAPRCTSAAIPIFDGLVARSRAQGSRAMSQQDAWAWGQAFECIGYTGTQNYGNLTRFLGVIMTLTGVQGTVNTGRVMDTMFEEEAIAAIGIAPFVLHHPTALSGLANKPNVLMGACTAAQLGTTEAQLAKAPPMRECVRSVIGEKLDVSALGE